MGLILVVDDDPSTLGLLEILFHKENYQVIKAGGGSEAIVLARKYKPDLVLLDLMMPDIDGLTVCQVIRQDPEIGQTPIIILTAVRSIDKKLQGIELGADAYLTKPVHPDELRAQARALIHRFRRVPQPQLVQNDSQVIAVIGASDKAGTSTIALNLAASAVESFPDTILIEPLPGCSGISDLLGLPQPDLGPHWSNLAAQEVSAANLKRLFLTHPGGLKILPSGVDIRADGSPDRLNPEQIQDVIRALSQDFHCVFLDLGRGFNNWVQAIRPCINDYIVVMRADSLSLPASAEQVRLLVEKGISWDHIFIALVAFDPYPNFLTVERSKQILQANGIKNNFLLYLPPSGQLIHTAAHEHVPMVFLKPDGQTLHQSFQKAMWRLVTKKESLAN